jgi:tight adherence protein C
MTNSWLLGTQLLVAMLVGILAYRVIRWASIRFARDNVRLVKERLSNWPSPARHAWFCLAPFVYFSERWARPSVKLGPALSALGFDSRFGPLEFSIFRGACTLLAVACVAVGLAGATVFWDVSWGLIVFVSVISGGFVFLTITTRVVDRHRTIQRQVSRSFPNFLDVLSLTLESGKNFQSALQISTQQLPVVGSGAGLRSQLQELLRDIVAGGSKISALQRFSERLVNPEIVQFSATVIAAERQGVSVAALLRRQAEQLRTSQALAAERHAMKLPVKLLAPLAICIFPCTFLVLAFPLAVRLLGSGLF